MEILSVNNLALNKSKILVAIDGYSGCGKSTTARQVAARLGYTYVDTGAMYRAVALYFFQNKISLLDLASVYQALDMIYITFTYNINTHLYEITLNGNNVEDAIRDTHIANFVSKVSALPEVRHVITKQQCKMGESKGVVMDGRDIGTKVFPDAELKIFMIADLSIRATRRQIELLNKGKIVSYNEVLHNLKVRDYDDMTRLVSPLCKADDAFLIDTSCISIDEQVERILEIANKKIADLSLDIV